MTERTSHRFKFRVKLVDGRLFDTSVTEEVDSYKSRRDEWPKVARWLFKDGLIHLGDEIVPREQVISVRFLEYERAEQ